MPSTVLSTPVRRVAAVPALVALAGAALALAPAAGAAPSGALAGAAAHPGAASAVVLRAGLDVSLLHKAVDVPVEVTLDDVHAPGNAGETAVGATVGGLGGGRPFTLLRADVATASATADSRSAHGYANLVNARMALPGLLAPLLTVKAATSKATCAAGHHPTASSDVLGTVEVLGRPVTLAAGGSTTVSVAGVGRVVLSLSQTSTSSSTAAATALHLGVALDPLGLGVAKAAADVTLVHADCRTPSGGSGGPSSGGSSSGGPSSGGSGNGGSGNGGSGNGGSGNGGASASGGSGSGGATSGPGGSGGSSSPGGPSSGGSHGGTASGGSSSGGSSSGAHSGGSSSPGGSPSGGPAGTSGHPQLTPTENLAETGASPAAPLLAVGAVVLVGAGGTVLYAARRRAGAAERD